MSLEMAHKVIVPQKKIMSRSFLNSGTLIVIPLFLLPALSSSPSFLTSLSLYSPVSLPPLSSFPPLSFHLLFAQIFPPPLFAIPLFSYHFIANTSSVFSIFTYLPSSFSVFFHYFLRIHRFGFKLSSHLFCQQFRTFLFRFLCSILFTFLVFHS